MALYQVYSTLYTQDLWSAEEIVDLEEQRKGELYSQYMQDLSTFSSFVNIWGN